MNLICGSEKISDVREFYELWKDCSGMRIRSENRIVNVHVAPLCITKTIFLETNLPKNKNVEIKIIDDKFSVTSLVKTVYVCIVYSHNVIVFGCMEKLYDPDIKCKILKDEFDKLYTQKNFYRISGDKIFDNLFFRGTKIKDLSMIRKFYEENPKARFIFLEIDRNLHIELNYIDTQACIIFTDEKLDKDKFYVTNKEIFPVEDGYTVNANKNFHHDNIIFRGNNIIEIYIIHTYRIRVPTVNALNEAEIELVNQHKKIYNYK